MSKTKQFVVDFLKEKGAEEEEISKFEELYDEQVTNMMKSEAEQKKEEKQAEDEKNRVDISKMAQDVNITE